MKRYKRFLFVCIAACSVFLSGCGDALHELTLEEEDLIVHYAAYVVAKHNIQQKDGLSGVPVPEEPQSTEEQTPIETETQNSQDSQNPGGQDGSQEAPQVEDTSVTLVDALGVSDSLKITYDGYVVADNYVEGSAYSVDAEPGHKFYVMKFVIENPTETDVVLENVTKGLGFKLKAEELSVKSEVTFLMSDLSTYYGTIPAGASVETVLLFEVPADKAETISEPALQIIIDDEIKNVKL